MKKQVRCNRWVWGYISRYAYLREHEIAGATTDYTAAEVGRAIVALVHLGYIQEDAQRHGYVALVPFVVQAPVWASR